jgi:Ecdysteroid kinase-like family
LAAFQAANIIYERLELRPEGSSIGDAHKDVLFETSYTKSNGWCMTGIRALRTVALQNTKYGFGSDYETTIEDKFMEKVCEIFDLLEFNDSTIPRVCCHRDLWKNNLMYRVDNDEDEPSHCLLIDFQICRYLPLTLDVIICILLSSRDHSNTDVLLKFYYEQLASELKRHDVNISEVVSWIDFEVSCKRFKLVPLVQQAIFWSLTNLPEEYLVELLETNETEYMKICMENRDNVVLEFMAKDDYYRETMTESVERLIEYLFVDGIELNLRLPSGDS